MEALLKWCAGALAAVLAWLGIDIYKRVKKLEEGHVTRADFDELRVSMMETIMGVHRDLSQRLDKIWERLSK